MLDNPRHAENRTRSSAAEKAPTPGSFLFRLCSPAADNLVAAQQVGDAITRDWLKFVADRMSKDISFPEQLAGCKTIDEVYVLYGEFWQQTARDYAAEYTTIANLVWNAMRAAPSCSSDKGQSCGRCDGAKSAA